MLACPAAHVLWAGPRQSCEQAHYYILHTTEHKGKHSDLIKLRLARRGSHAAGGPPKSTVAPNSSTLDKREPKWQ